jgi:hypothetical protein
MKSKIPPFDELIDRLITQVQKRHPDKPITSELVETFRNGWKHQQPELYKMVKQLEINSNKVESINNRLDERHLQFQIGVDILGNPIYHEHKVLFKRDYQDPKRYSKKGSKVKYEDSYFFTQKTFVVPN